MGEILPAGHGFAFICFLLEARWGIPVFCLWCGSFVSWVLGGGWCCFALSSTILPVCILLCAVFLLFFSSWVGTSGPADWSEYISFRDPAEARLYKGKKIPIDYLYEGYIHEKIDFKKDVYEVLLKRNELFSFAFSWRYSVRFFLGTLLVQNVGHSAANDKDEVAHVYDRGNDFYNWFLGPTMVYTSGIFEDEDEKLEVGQHRKLESVCKSVHMKQGSEHLDIGCGWGTLLRHAAQYYGANSLGITLAKEQMKWHDAECQKAGITGAVSKVLDYRKLPDKKYDCITCLEMAEHVGIKNFQKFLLQVKGLLKDDGLFYLQIAGLRRAWQYEDLMWGIFMGQYIFPAADASCPLGFVTTQLERAGFEVHRVENTGVHYSLTIKKWYDNWITNKDKVVKKYGEYWFRLWAVFLAWSAIIAAQGSSTVFMITNNINHKNDARSVYNGKKKGLFSRMDAWVGKDTLATQQ